MPVAVATAVPVAESSVVGPNVVVGQQVAPGREQLTKFDEYGAEIFQCSTQAFASWGRSGH